jgi:hypothetical protein
MFIAGLASGLKWDFATRTKAILDSWSLALHLWFKRSWPVDLSGQRRTVIA